MRKSLIVLILLIFPFHCISQCCSSTQQFAAFSRDNRFAAAHDAPLPFELTNEKGNWITFQYAGTKQARAYEIKALKATNNWLLIFHEWWGLNDYIKQEAERFSKELDNVNILAIDLYDGKVAETPAIAQQLMSGLMEDSAVAIVQGAIDYTGKKSKIFTIGWCMGGGWSMQAAIAAGSQATAAVIYYGMPETDPVQIKKLKAEVLGIFASRDKWISPEVVSKFEKAMKDAGKKLTVKNFDADHAFANPSNPRFDEKNASEARKLVLQFLRSRIR